MIPDKHTTRALTHLLYLWTRGALSASAFYKLCGRVWTEGYGRG